MPKQSLHLNRPSDFDQNDDICWQSIEDEQRQKTVETYRDYFTNLYEVAPASECLENL